MKSQLKPETKLRELQGWWTQWYTGRGSTMGESNPLPHHPPISCLIHVFHLVVPKLCNKSSWVLWVTVVNTEPGVREPLNLKPSQTEMWVGWRPRTRDMHLKWGQSCGTKPLTWGGVAVVVGGWVSVLTLGTNAKIELNCRIPSWYQITEELMIVCKNQTPVLPMSSIK